MPPPQLKTVLITGCSAGGIGSSLAQTFHSHGLHVFATSRSLSTLSHLSSIPGITVLELDVVSDSSIATALQTVTAQTGGKLDYLVNNSGRAFVMPTLDSNIEEAKKMFDVNFWGAVAVTQAFAPLVVAARGSVVNMCSILGYLHTPWTGMLLLLSFTLSSVLAPLFTPSPDPQSHTHTHTIPPSPVPPELTPSVLHQVSTTPPNPP